MLSAKKNDVLEATPQVQRERRVSRATVINVSTNKSASEVLKASGSDLNTVPTEGTGNQKSTKVTTLKPPAVSPIKSPTISKDQIAENKRDSASSGSSLGSWTEEVDKINKIEGDEQEEKQVNETEESLELDEDEVDDFETDYNKQVTDSAYNEPLPEERKRKKDSPEQGNEERKRTNTSTRGRGGGNTRGRGGGNVAKLSQGQQQAPWQVAQSRKAKKEEKKKSPKN